MLQSIIRGFIDKVLVWRRAVLVIWFAIFIIGLIFTLRLSVDNNVERLVSTDDPRRQLYAEFISAFGSDEYSVIALERKDGIYDKAFLGGVEKIAAAFQKIKHTGPITSVISKYRQAGKLGPLNMVDMAWLKRLWEADPLNVQAGLLNKDGTVISLIVPILHDVKNPRVVVVPGINKVIADFEHQPEFAGVIFHKVGQPQLNYFLDYSATEVGIQFFPIFFSLTIFLLIFLYRSGWATVAAIITLAVTVLATLGIMSAMHIPMSLVTTLLPVALFLILLAGIIHLMNGFFDPHGNPGDSITERLEEVLSKKFMASLMAATTTMVGFGSLAISNMPSIQELGVFMAIGMLIGFVANYSLFPVLMGYFFKKLPNVNPDGNTEDYTPRTEFILHRLFDWTVKARWVIFLGGIGLGVAAAYTITLMEFETNPLNYLDEKNEAKAEITWFEKNMTGSATLEVMLKSPEKGAFYDPKQVLWLTKFSQELEKVHGVRAAISIPEMLKEGKGMAWGFFEYPANAEEVSFYLDAIKKSFPDMLKGFITPDGKMTRITLVTDSVDYTSFSDIQKRAHALLATFTKSNPPPFPVTMQISGQTELLANISSYLSETMLYSFMFTLLGVSLLIFLTFRAFRVTAVAIMQNLFGISLMFGFMWVVGINLNIVTIIIASILLGIEVDTTIHFLYHAIHARQRHMSFRQSMHHSLSITGRAIVVTNTIISAGFCVFLTSDFPPIRNFGALIAIGMAFATVGVLVFLPAAVAILTPKLGVRNLSDDDDDSDAGSAPAERRVNDGVAP